MRELVEYIARNLVDNPDGVRVSERDGDDQEITVIELSVDEPDMGKVIGKQGRIAKAMRTIVKAAAMHTDKKYVVEIV